ncbi:MAG: hypothetical protein HUJ57_06795 [Erysipelotrichaceae bacterium]|nr:hypothetical protein [Erysipelotrichaceae bacterium]
MRIKCQELIEQRIQEFEHGYAFTAMDFLDLADAETANKALSRLSESGAIRRIIKGVYDRPYYSQIIKEVSDPYIGSVAMALARKFNWTIGPTGETALNELHVSTQITNHFVYISDGPYRKYEIGSYVLEFRHCANREVSGKSHITITVIQAIKAIGRDSITQKDISILSAVLRDEDKQTIIRESRNSTEWVHRILKEVCHVNEEGSST